MKLFARKRSSKDASTRKHSPPKFTRVPTQKSAPVQTSNNSFVQRQLICPCDGGCPRCAPVIQLKLTIGQPNDIYEQEAGRVADEVMRMPEPQVHSDSQKRE